VCFSLRQKRRLSRVSSTASRAGSAGNWNLGGLGFWVTGFIRAFPPFPARRRLSSGRKLSARTARIVLWTNNQEGKSMQLQGVGAIVTGGASGLGAATARELAKAGAKVAVFDMNAEQGELVAKEIGGVFVKCDVADGPGGEAAVKEAIAKVGPVRVLVNCAGVGTPMKAVGKDGPVALEKFV